MVFATASDPLELDSKDFVQVYALGRSEFDGGVLSIDLVSRKSGAAGAVAGASCLRPSVSDDGLVIVFDTSAPLADTKELGGPDLNGVSDVYVRDLRGAEPVTRRLSVRTVNNVPDEPNGPSFHAGISGDGNVVAFTSSASDLVAPNTDTNARDDVFAVFATDGSANPVLVSLDNCDRQSFTTAFSTIGTTLPVSRGVGSVVSSVGPRIVFAGAPCDWDTAGCALNTALCASLNCVNCASAGRHQVYIRDFGTMPPSTSIVSRGVQGGSFVPGDQHSQRPSISDDGLNIAFESLARNLTAASGTDPDTFRDVFRLAESQLLDPAARPVHISLPFTGLKSDINGHSHSPMQLDDEHTVYASECSRLVDENNNGAFDDDTNARADIFVLNSDVVPPWTRRYSVRSDRTQAVGGHSLNPDMTRIAGTGRIVVCESAATNLDPQDGNGLQDVFESWSPQGQFLRGDVNKDGCVNADDRDMLSAFLFEGGDEPPGCPDARDATDDGLVNLTDFSRLASFVGSACVNNPPPAPFPGCGNDPTGDGLTGEDAAPTQICQANCTCP